MTITNVSRSREKSRIDASSTAALVQKISDCCRREERVIAAYLFGSGAAGRLVAGSDIDVAVLVAAEHEADFPALELAVSLEGTLGVPVDLIVLNRAGELLKHQVRRYGFLVYEKDPHRRKQFEVTGRKLYEDFLHLHRRYVATVLYQR